MFICASKQLDVWDAKLKSTGQQLRYSCTLTTI